MQWNAGGGQRVVWFGCCMPLHIPLFLRNDRAVGLRDHIVGYLRFRVILESQSPLVIISALSFVHSEIGPLQVLLLGVKIALACLKASGAADLGGFLLVVRVVRVLQVLGDGRVGGQAPGLTIPISKHMFLGAVVTFEGVLAAAQEYEEQYGRHTQQGNSPHSAPDGGTCIVLLLRDLRVPRCRVLREFWVGKDRWKGVCQCSGGRRCVCAGADFFFFRKDEVRETRTEKQRGKEGPSGATTKHPQTQRSPYRQCGKARSLTVTCSFRYEITANAQHNTIQE